MEKIKIKYNFLLVLIILSALILRLVPIDFPVFTSDEAKVAFRGYVISVSGKDELGRRFPVLFNSLQDYQLPVVSYLTVSGELIFGKSEIGARIPFIILGMLLAFLTYQIAKFFSQSFYFQFISALVVVFSPTLIFLSKTPNEEITLTFILTLIFYLLISRKSLVFVILAMIAAVLTSKQAWFVLLPFVSFTSIFYQKFLKRRKFILIGFSVILTLVVFVSFLFVPQARRSLSENNFSIFSSITIKNGIDKLRGQGIQSGWPPFIDRTLFNKGHFLVIGFMQWLSNLQPSIYFGQFDKTGQMGFSQMGALGKILIIPFILGIVYLVRKGKKKERLLPAYFIILTFPAIFIYPDFSQSLLVVTLPFAALIAAFGFMQFNRTISLLIILAMVLEVGLNLLYLAPEEKNTNFLRPNWVRGITQDVYNQSINYKTAISDDVLDDIVNFIEWYNPVDARAGYLNVPDPYKFRQSNIKNIKIIGSDNKLYSCRENDYDKVFVSRRDMDRIKDYDIGVVKTYQDGLNKEVAYLLQKGLCIR